MTRKVQAPASRPAGKVEAPGPDPGQGLRAAEAGSESAFSHSAFNSVAGVGGGAGAGMARAVGLLAPKRRLLVAVALLGCLVVFLVARWLALSDHLPGSWSVSAQSALVLHANTPALDGKSLQALGASGELRQTVDASLLQRSPRWQASGRVRAEMLRQHRLLDHALAQGSIDLSFSDGSQATVLAQPRGYTGLGWLFWMLSGAALVVFLAGWVVALARPLLHNLLFLLMALCQSANLLAMAAQTLPGLGLPLPLLILDMPLRLSLDFCTGAAVVHAFALYPHRLAHCRRVAWTVWPSALLMSAIFGLGLVRGSWWWGQGLVVSFGVASWAMARWSYRIEPHPFALAMQRFAIAAVATLALMSIALALSTTLPDLAHGIVVGASVTWYLFFASLTVLVPFLGRSRGLMRELALLAGISTVAISLDLMVVSLFAVGPLPSLAIAGAMAVALYAGARQYFLDRMLGSSMLTTERIFDALYRAARALQAKPERYPLLLSALMGDLFEPLKLQRVAGMADRARVADGGATLTVPVADFASPLPAPGGAARSSPVPPHALLLRYAQRGRRLFTADDARLANRLVEQLRRAAAYDQAVERGRTEERQRIAQDLHDDIGARLLTLMYQASTPDMEDYIRHTLQDLKTLTRGLAAAEQTLAHAAAEWKADLSQRLSAARAHLAWSLQADSDPRLSMVQWSALTRILRELVSNSLFHGHATRIEVSIELHDRRLQLRVSDDGKGQAPQHWAHGLGLGGVRKRVKALAGQVAWSEQAGGGIVCVVLVPQFQIWPTEA